ncbi:penicillin-binding transpeptidase domain-containing protein [Carnobacterium inhibens]|uniref:Penicillin-binding transpeptidase domain-containing protein n=1 Tax=Carnobacterium inhibens TaxID=147709 RepID=A0ABR7TDP9_9LACT|nr:penicillin-binding transpeptidase domain-containing protein [Carnobacterium inhibens]MBC9825837.1 penicillin-binding transpeptidase domain-containing protein [Carnobacterium inhibens]
MKNTRNKSEKKRPLWLLIAIIVAVLALIGVGIIGYSIWAEARDEKAAMEVAASFITALEKQDYTAMSQLVSEESLTAIDYTKESMAERYETVYGGVGAAELNVSDNTTVTQEEGADYYDLSYTVNMETALGTLDEKKYETTLSKTDDGYKVDWNTHLIFPDMEPTDKVSLTTTVGERGDILDKNGSPLATEGTSWQAGMQPSALGEGDQRTTNLEKIAETYDVTVEELESLLEQGWVTPDSFVPFKGMPQDAELPQVTGVVYQEVTARTYPLNEAAAHLIGYVGEVSAENIEKDPTLRTGDVIGKSGLEATYDERLRGQKGGRIEILTDDGELKMVLQETEVQNGEDITLTINAEIQQAAYDQLTGQSGSAVFMNPTDGSLLALVSTPSYDANLMSSGISSEQYQAYVDDPMSPFLARYAAGYAPGSTFKVVTAGIGLDAGTIIPEETQEISGLSWQKDESWGDYKVTRVKDVASVNLADAFAYSDNIYFARQALDMGRDTYEAGLKQYIFGEDLKLPIAMNPAQISNSGTLDSEGMLADTAFGQGELLLSPIQQAVTYTPFANNGKLVYPKLTADQETAEAKQPVTPESAAIVKEDLVQTVQKEYGSSHKLAVIDQKTAAKTGTAETRESETEGEDAETNGFLMAFDAENSSYLMVAMIEGESSGAVIDKMLPVLEKMEAYQ